MPGDSRVARSPISDDDRQRSGRPRDESNYGKGDGEHPRRRRDEGSRHRYREPDESDNDREDRHQRHRRDRSRGAYRRDFARDDVERESGHSRRSPPTKRRRPSRSVSRSPPRRSRSPSRRSRAPLPSQNELFRGGTGPEGAGPPAPEKQKPNFKPTGLLAKEANTVAGTTTVLKYHEPPEARKPPLKEQWRMFVFKKKDLLDTIHLHQRSVWLAGRDAKVTDLFLEHPSISKQHAVIQFRHISSTNQYGDKSSKVKPYLIDLESANGTKLNGRKIEASRFVELVDADVVAFGDSEREYVLMLPPPDV